MKTDPPKLIRLTMALIDRCCDEDIKETFLVFIQSKFIDLKRRRGTAVATTVCLFHSAQLMLSHLIETSVWRFTMFRNYVKTAIRHFRSHKTYTAINILGLSVALACAILIFLFIRDELSYDAFHENADAIYSVIERDHHFDYHYRHTPTAVGPGMERFFPEVSQSVRMIRQPAVVKYEDRLLSENIHLVDPEFLSMFSFPLTHGSTSALDSEDAIVLTASSAAGVFGTADPIGKTMTITFGAHTKDFVVNGLLEDIPSNSTLRFDLLIHVNNFTQLRGPDALTSWTWPRANTYIRLAEDSQPERLLERIPHFIDQNFTHVEEKRRNGGSWIEDGPTLEYWFQPLKDIYLKSSVISGNEYSDVSRSIILGGLGVLILTIAVINFTNLSVGRASARAREIAVRKVTGAKRRSLILQFWVESVTIVMASLMAGCILAGMLLPRLNTIAAKQLDLQHLLNPPTLGLLIVSGFVLGIAAGCFPSLVMSRFRPVEIIKGRFKVGGRNILTRVLIVVQFSVSVFLLIATITLTRQIAFINAKHLGFEKEGIVVINTMERDYASTTRIADHFRQKADGYPDIHSVSGCVFPFSAAGGEGTTDINGIQKHFLFTSVYYGFVETMDMRIVEGRDFSENHPSDRAAVVVNRQFVEQFEIENPIGFPIDESSSYTIIGVVEDYNYQSVRHAVEPVIHFLDQRSGPRTLLIRISTADIGHSLSTLETIWTEIQPNKPFTYSFFEDELNQRYQDERRWSGILTYASVLSIFITCLGLIGITALTTSRRVKEIGVRKVMGATTVRIMRLLIQNFLLLVSIALVVAWPLGFYAMNRWLQGYAYRTTLRWDAFLLSGILAFVIAALTVGTQTIRAAAANPVDSLRDE